MANDQTAIVRIHELLNWFAKNEETVDIGTMTIRLGELSTWTANFADQVAGAHEQMNNSELAYDRAVLESIRAMTEAGVSVAKAERDAKAEHIGKKGEYIKWKNLYKQFELKIKAIDRVIDVRKQRVSTLKQMEMKNL